MEHTIQATTKVTTDDIVQLFSCESDGFDYWASVDCEMVDYRRAKEDLERIYAEKGSSATIFYEDVLAHMLEIGMSVTINEFEEDNHYELTLERLLRGFQLNYVNRPYDSDISEGDATTADCILQYAIFDDVVYG